MDGYSLHFRPFLIFVELLVGSFFFASILCQSRLRLPQFVDCVLEISLIDSSRAPRSFLRFSSSNSAPASGNLLISARMSSVSGAMYFFGSSIEEMGRVESRHCACPPSSNRACSFPAHGFPMFFTSRHAPSSSLLSSALCTSRSCRTGLYCQIWQNPPSCP